MRYVKKDINDIPTCLNNAETLSDLEQIAKGKKDVSDKIYKGEYKDENGKIQSYVREKLNIYYYGKCAYCEMLCKAEIEHYRPKKSVTGEKHDGYYWLCYEWTNLVPACRYCNTEGGKGTQFPIMGTRTFAPEFKNGKLDKQKCKPDKSPLFEEKPYLLHPEYDEPNSFLGFKINDSFDGIDIIGIDTEKRGDFTVKICNLNLLHKRKARQANVIEDIKGAILFIFNCTMKEHFPMEKTKNMLISYFKINEDKYKNDKIEHTLLWKFIFEKVENFENIICPFFSDPNQRVFLKETFKKYKFSLEATNS